MSRQRSSVRGGTYDFCEPAWDDKSSRRHRLVEVERSVAACRLGSAAAHDGELRIVQYLRLASDIENDRPAFQSVQRAGIARVGERHDMVMGIFYPGAFHGAGRAGRAL